MRGFRQFRNKAKAIRAVGKMLGKNVGNLLKTMDHSNTCQPCNDKLMAVFACAGIATSDTKFGVLKLAKHLPKCQSCQTNFKAIADHANQPVNVESLDAELAGAKL